MVPHVSDMRTDEELMLAYCAGDKRAFRELFDRYSGMLLGMHMRGMRSQKDAGDLVQKTFLQLHRVKDSFEHGRALRPWLMTIGLNVKRQHLRTMKRRPEDVLELDGRSDPAEAPYDPEVRERREAVHQALQKLPDKQREVIELHWLSGLPMAEVAEVLGASKSAVKVRAHRGYEQLRQILVKMGVTMEGGPA